MVIRSRKESVHIFAMLRMGADSRFSLFDGMIFPVSPMDKDRDY